ncbi:MAG: DUF1295 domain-containing protein [Pseudomonadales bacterium]|nr:DUF1295 domain-containing protein [Pseudomonadales bacterium]
MSLGQQIGGIFLALFISLVFAFIGSDQGEQVAGLSLFVLLMFLSFGVNWLMFIHSWLNRSEKLFDLVGSITFVLVTLLALVVSGNFDLRALLISAAIIVWALRLGPFLHGRIVKSGEDRRFRYIKQSFTWLLMTWTMQANWVFVTAACGLAALTSSKVAPPDWTLFVGFSVWCFGFAVEVIADRQKSAFKADPNNDGRFIQSGLWAWSRHPNYFGEILLWAGVALMAVPALLGNQMFTLVAPLFVIAQLTLISGVPLLERRADKIWGDEAAYQKYKRQTPALMLWPPR